MKVGDNVSVNLAGLHPYLREGAWVNGTIVSIKGSNEIVVRVPQINGKDEFTVESSRIIEARSD